MFGLRRRDHDRAGGGPRRRIRSLECSRGSGRRFSAATSSASRARAGTGHARRDDAPSTTVSDRGVARAGADAGAGSDGDRFSSAVSGAGSGSPRAATDRAAPSDASSLQRARRAIRSATGDECARGVPAPGSSIRPSAFRRTRQAGRGVRLVPGRRRSASGSWSAVHALHAAACRTRRPWRAASRTPSVRRCSSSAVHPTERRGVRSSARHTSRRRGGAARGEIAHACDVDAGAAAESGGIERRIACGGRITLVSAGWREPAFGRDPRSPSDQSISRQRSEREGEASGASARVGHRRVLSPEA